MEEVAEGGGECEVEDDDQPDEEPGAVAHEGDPDEADQEGHAAGGDERWPG